MQLYFFKDVTDTCAISETYNNHSDMRDPETSAGSVVSYGDPGVMIRARMHRITDGTKAHGHSVGVLVHEITTAGCWTDPDNISKMCSANINFPGTGPGTYHCVTDNDALIEGAKVASDKLFLVQKDYAGVSGTIDVRRHTDDPLSGNFSGTLGHRNIGRDPEEEPPSDIMEIQNGFLNIPAYASD